MKNRILCLTVLLLSLFTFITSFNDSKAYYYNYKGNSLFKNRKYEEAREKYNLALSIKDSQEIKNSIIKSYYEEKKYKEVVDTPSSEYFLRGNAFALLGDEAVKTNSEEGIKNYKAALEEYKTAMKSSDDVNIKKNYEIILKKIEDLEKQQNQQQQNQNNQNKDNQKQKNNNSQENKDQQNQSNDQNQNNNQENQKDKQEQNNNQSDKQKDNKENNQQNNQQNKDSQSDKEKQNDNQQDSRQNNENQSKKKEQSDNQQNNQSDKQKDEQQSKEQNGSGEQKEVPASAGEVQPVDEKSDGRKEEIRVILKRLEGNEKQSFKNNERMINIDTGNSNNRW